MIARRVENPGRETNSGPKHMPTDRVNILGVGVSAINMEMALSAIEEWIIRRERTYVCIRDVHGIVESQRDEKLRQIHNAAGLVTPDGMPLVWLCRVRGFSHTDRVYGPDLMLAVCAHSAKKRYRHFFYGGAPGVPERLAQNLVQEFPGLQIAGTYSPPYRPMQNNEDQEIVRKINQSCADIIWVGLSTPKQEYWMAEHRDRLAASVLIGVGAAFDFRAGTKRQAPRWMQRSGLEWSFRLATEPGRLWRRYLIDSPVFLWLILMQSLKIKRYDLA